MCGGTNAFVDSDEKYQGLSPRVRGNPAHAEEAGAGLRSIPACAGEPCASSWPAVMPRVYPRVCGGTPWPSPTTARPGGLSPRVRGNRRRDKGSGKRSRSIPACAGEPCRASAACETAGVYPRVCGGTAAWTPGGRAAWGLSPRVRGNPDRYLRRHRKAGSIPACAGEPCADCLFGDVRGVYPRVCGGTGQPLTGVMVQAGLSPRVRGNLVSRPAARLE